MYHFTDKEGNVWNIKVKPSGKRIPTRTRTGKYEDFMDRLSKEPKSFDKIFLRDGYVYKGIERLVKYEGQELFDIAMTMDVLGFTNEEVEEVIFLLGGEDYENNRRV